MKGLLAVIAVLAVTLPAAAGVKTELVEYKQGDVVLQGYISFDESATGKRPGIVVIHDWMGVSDDTKMRTEMLAKLGYVALAADIYGKGVRPSNAQEAMAEAGKFYKDRALLRARAKAGLDFLMGRPEVDPSRVAVMGYCFGGGAALELAMTGAPLKGVVTFHGSLSTPTPEDAKNIKGKVLVLHGADDPFVKQSDVTAFMDEMRKAGVDWELVQYSGAVHAFTIRSAGSNNSKGTAYNAEADRRSWQAMKDFFQEIFGGREM
ncbi:MAG TPA: dienelactone hydrolase family protein [Bacteroidota bacterium]|nr:dienelactone hydrolase family protein [Bacteroidota bacterium]